MNTPAEVSKEHCALWNKLYNLAFNECFGGDSSDAKAAQLIADSEALAVAEIAMVAAASADRNVSLRLERDQLRAELATCKDASEALVESLRAEVERLRECCDQTSALCGKFITEDDGTDLIPNSARIANALARLEARAERAEASLHALRLVCGTTDADKFSTWVDRANAKAEKAEAELANIRALANRRNKRDHSADTTHQLVAALDQALDIAQAELAQFRELDAERARMRQISVDKRIRTPTPRTDEEAGSLIDAEEVVPADFARTFERELAAERARVDQLILTHPLYDSRDQLDAAIKEGA